MKRPLFILVLFSVSFLIVLAADDPTAGLSDADKKVVNGVDAPDPGSSLYKKWCENVKNLTPFTLGSHLNCPDNSESFSIGLMIAVFITVLIELFTRKLEHRVENIVTKQIINKVYKELMILGIISFSIVFLEASTFLEVVFNAFMMSGTLMEDTHSVTARRVKVFEVVHIVVFALSIYYIIVVIITYLLCKVTWKRWASYEDLERSNRNAIVQRYQAFRERTANTRWYIWIFNPKIWWEYFTIIDKMNYLSVRNRFITVNGLRYNFPFDIYLKARIRRLLLEVVEIDYKAWCILFFGAFLNYLRFKTMSLHSNNSGVILFVSIIGIGSLLAMIILFLYTRIAYAIYVRQHSLTKASVLNNSSLSESFIADQKNEDNTLHFDETLSPTQLIRVQKHIFEQNIEKEAERNHREKILAQYDHDAEDDETDTYTGIKPVNDSLHESVRLDTLVSIDYEIHMSKYMFCKHAVFHFTVLQFCLLIQCFYMAMLSVHFGYMIIVEDLFGPVHKNIRVLILLSFCVPPILSCGIFFPLNIAPFTILSSVDNMSSHELIIFALERQNELVHIEKNKNRFVSYNPIQNEILEEEGYDSLVHSPQQPEYFSAYSRRERKQINQLKSLIERLKARQARLEQKIARKGKLTLANNDNNQETKKDSFDDFYYDSTKDEAKKMRREQLKKEMAASYSAPTINFSESQNVMINLGQSPPQAVLGGQIIQDNDSEYYSSF